MSRPPHGTPSFSTRALVALCFMAVFASWAVVELGVWGLTHAIEWITGSSVMEQKQEYVGMAMVKIFALNALAWALIAAGVALLAWTWS